MSNQIASFKKHRRERNLRLQALELGRNAQANHDRTVELAKDHLAGSLREMPPEGRALFEICVREVTLFDSPLTIVCLRETELAPEPGTYHCEIAIGTMQEELRVTDNAAASVVDFTTRLMTVAMGPDGIPRLSPIERPITAREFIT